MKSRPLYRLTFIVGAIAFVIVSTPSVLSADDRAEEVSLTWVPEALDRSFANQSAQITHVQKQLDTLGDEIKTLQRATLDLLARVQQDASVMETRELRDELNTRLAAVGGNVTQVQSQMELLRGEVGSLKASANQRPEPSRLDELKQMLPYLSVLGLVLLFAILLIQIIQGRQLERKLGNIKSTRAAAVGAAVKTDSAAGVTAGETGGKHLNRIESTLKEVLESAHRLEDELRPLSSSSNAVDMGPVISKIQQLGQQNEDVLKRLNYLHATLEEKCSAPPPVVPAAPPAVPETTADGRKDAVLDKLWPDIFHQHSGLQDSRPIIEAGLQSRNPAAMGLLAAVIDFDLQLKSSDLTVVAMGKALAGLSTAMYRWYYQLPEEHRSAEVSIPATWLSAYRSLCNDRFPALEVKAYFTGSQFDSEVMERDDNSGSRPSIKYSLSWLVLDQSGPKPRILQRANVITE